MADKAKTVQDQPLTGEQIAAIQPEPIGALAVVAASGFGSPSFSWPEKTYATKDGKTTTHARYTVQILGTPFVVDAVIWRTLGQTDGNPTEEFSVGLPRGIVLSDGKSDDLRDSADTWKMSVLTMFEQWSDGQGPNSASAAKRRTAPRLVKRLTATPAGATK